MFLLGNNKWSDLSTGSHFYILSCGLTIDYLEIIVYDHMGYPTTRIICNDL